MKSKNYLIGSLVIVILLVATAVYGLFVPGSYGKESANWSAQTRAQDWLDLIVVAPLLALTAISAFMGSLRGFTVWLGTLFFIVYSFFIYAFMLHFSVMFLSYVSILGLSIYLTIFALVGADYDSIKKGFIENWSRKVVSYFLIILGTLFYLVWFKDIIISLLSGELPKSMVEAGLLTNGVYVLDIALYLPALILSGYYLLGRRKEGYLLAGASLVFSVIMMANIAFIIYYTGLRGLPTDYSIAYVFGFLSIVAFYIVWKYLASTRIGKKVNN